MRKRPTGNRYGVNRGLRQPRQQENSLFELKGKKTEESKEVAFLDFTGRDHR